ncbi:MAG: MotA/TolQ/ExbB proton channel family protein [Chthoniobacteraceae bacterium]
MNGNQTNSGRTFALTGAYLQLGVLVGKVGTVIGMMHAFDTLGGSNVSDPRQLAASISTVLIATFVGLVFGVVGFVLIGVSIFACGYRARWCFWFLVVYGGILLLGFPIGTAIGLAILIYCYGHRDEFLRRNPPGLEVDAM